MTLRRILRRLRRMSAREVDALLSDARDALRARNSALESLRAELYTRIQQSGYSIEEIFDGQGSYPRRALRAIQSRLKK